MFVHRDWAAMQEHDFLAVGSSVLLEGIGQKGHVQQSKRSNCL